MPSEQNAGTAKTLEFSVPADAEGQRLDAFLTARLTGVSRSRVQFLIHRGQVTVNGTEARAAHRLHSEDSISVPENPEPPPLHAEPEPIPLEVIFEDDDLVVVNKPAGMMVHAGAGPTDDARNRGTLVNALLHRYSHLSNVGGPLRPGIVHRLDKRTSGLIIAAKNDWTHARLSRMFAEHRVEKTYLALVHGELGRLRRGSLPEDQGTVTAPVARDRARRTRMTTHNPAGRAAISHWQVLRRFDGDYGRFTLASIRIETGRTHQIRVHMASLGHPIVGDTLYGAPSALITGRIPGKRPRPGQPQRLVLSQNFLHAAHLRFAHPRTNRIVDLSSPLPPDLRQFLEQL